MITEQDINTSARTWLDNQTFIDRSVTYALVHEFAKSRIVRDYWRQGMVSKKVCLKEVTKILFEYDLYVAECKVGGLPFVTAHEWFNSIRLK